MPFLKNWLAFGTRFFGEELAEAARHGAETAWADGAAIDFGDGGEFAHGAGAEHFVGSIDFGQRQVALGVGDVCCAADFQDDGAGDAFGAGDGAGGEDFAAGRR